MCITHLQVEKWWARASERRHGTFSVAGTAALPWAQRVWWEFWLDLSWLLKKSRPKLCLKMCNSNNDKGLFSIYMIIAIESYANECEKMKSIINGCDMGNECEFRSIHRIWHCHLSRRTCKTERKREIIHHVKLKMSRCLDLVKKSVAFKLIQGRITYSPLKVLKIKNRRICPELWHV